LTANPTTGWYARFLREVFLATAQMAPRHDRTSVRHSDARTHRIRSGVSLELICERTKISRHFLEAIEERAYQRLPGGIFDISYIQCGVPLGGLQGAQWHPRRLLHPAPGPGTDKDLVEGIAVTPRARQPFGNQNIRSGWVENP
jgi:hypothetical protein